MPSPSRISRTASRDVLVLARDQPRTLLDDRHLGAEAAVHLREFEADVAAADDDQMPRQRVELQDRAVGQRRHVVDAGHVGNARAAAHIDEDARRASASRRRPRRSSVR